MPPFPMKQNNHDSLICEITYRRQYTINSQEYQKWLQSWQDKNTRRAIKAFSIDMMSCVRQIKKYRKTNDKDYERNYNHQYYLTVTKPKRERLKKKRHEKANKRMGTLGNIQTR